MTTDWGAIIVAAGSGTRFGGAAPKQYAPLAGRPVLAWSLEALRPHADPARTVLVVDPAHASFYAPFSSIAIAAPGVTRGQSVRAGLEALAENPPRFVLIHDAARPLVEAESIARLKAAVESGASSATLAVPVADMLMRGHDVIDRTDVQAVQTPQGFAFPLLLEAHRKAAKEYTDDCSLVRAETGAETVFVPGHADNFKITAPEDLPRAERVIAARHGDIRTGLGFDVHRFGPGDHLRLFGCDIPHTHALIGHSDADAGLHAIADAILGTIGADDIGVLFPPSEPAWKSMDSALIVQKSLDLLHDAGGILVHADATLLAEAPRIGPHRPAIAARLSGLLRLPQSAIGLKATTTEKLGFIGRGEGLAVQALVTVRLRR